MKALITRPQPDADQFAKECREAGIDPLVAPLMQIEFLCGWRLPETAVSAAFTSANGVRAFAKGCARRDLIAYCVGEATTAAACEKGFQEIKTAGGDVKMLAQLIADNPPPQSGVVFHIAGTRRAGDLVGLLREEGLAGERLTAYRMIEASSLPSPATEALRGSDEICVTLFSPRTARLFMRLAEAAGLDKRLSNHAALCLSEAVAQEASAARWRRIEIARERTGGAVIALMTKPA